jgi:cyclomaltodextrinase / maltogenic alpha-amylase / neopullulanase
MKQSIILLCVSLLVSACETNRQDAIVDVSHRSARISEEWVHDGIIYEVFLRSFSSEGTFAGLEKKLPELRDLGVNVLWLMPIHPVGEENKKGALGSPYSVRDYFEVNPEFGTMDDFISLLAAAHDHDFKLIIDLVANHTSWDNQLISQHPDWYVYDNEGNITHPAGTDWWDVADLNFDLPEVREYFKEVMRYWVEDIGIDGFRLDVSDRVPVDFWEEAREMLDEIKTVMILSEAAMPEHHLRAVDLTYSWNLYHSLPYVIYGDEPATMIDDILREEAAVFPRGSLRLRFKSNHDENAWDAPAVEKWGTEGAKAVGMLVTTMPGVPLLYNGDEVGNPKRLNLFEQIPIDWDSGEEYRTFYTDLFSIYNESTAFRRGVFIKIPTTDDYSIYSFIRMHERDTKYVLINLKPDTVTFDVSVNPVLDAEGMDSGTLVKEIGHGDDTFSVVYDDTISISMPGFGYAIYDVR